MTTTELARAEARRPHRVRRDQMPFGLHIGTKVVAPRDDAPNMPGRVVGRRTAYGQVWGVVVEHDDGIRNVVAVHFVRRARGNAA